MCGSKLTRRYADFGRWFHLPKFNFGTFIEPQPYVSVFLRAPLLWSVEEGIHKESHLFFLNAEGKSSKK